MPSSSNLVAISQRVVEVSDYGEFRDCLDQQWAVWLRSLGLLSFPVPNRLGPLQDALNQLRPQAIVLSGGNDIATTEAYAEQAPVRQVADVSRERDDTEAAMVEYAVQNQIPLLGCCRGMQFLQVFFGGRLNSLAGSCVAHVATTHEVAVTEPLATVAGQTSLSVNSFHDYGIAADALAPALQPLAVSTPDQTIEAFVHRSLPLVGIMWHPERPNPASEIDLRIASTLFGSSWPRS